MTTSILEDWPPALNEHVAEYKDGPVPERIREAKAKASAAVRTSIEQSLSAEAQARLYAVVRDLRPTLAVETGTCNGVSTAVITEALARTGEGHLHSIDYPYREGEDLGDFQEETASAFKGACIPQDRPPGWIVPAGRSERWTLHEGKSQHVLPRLLSRWRERGQALDLFLHDSEHSLPCQAMELELAFHHAADGAVIACDDAGWARAFEAAAEKHQAPWAWLADGVAVAAKRRR